MHFMLQGALLVAMVAGSQAFSAQGFVGSSVVRSRSSMCGRPSQRLAHATLAAPRLRGPPALAALSMDSGFGDWYKVDKVEDIEGGARYTYTVTVEASVSKQVYGTASQPAPVSVYEKGSWVPG